MRVLIVGSGGREHALAWKLAQSPDVSEVFCAPGNPGMPPVATCIPIGAADIVELADFAEKTKIELTLVGPELPLTLGLVLGGTAAASLRLARLISRLDDDAG